MHDLLFVATGSSAFLLFAVMLVLLDERALDRTR